LDVRAKATVPYIWNGKKKGKGQKNITIKKVFGDKEPKDLSLEECKKAVAGKLKPKAKPKKRFKFITVLNL
jgi:DNA topoisomerase-1